MTTTKIPRGIPAKLTAGLVSPQGTTYPYIYNLHKFCREHGLDTGLARHVLTGRRLSHLGWRKYDSLKHGHLPVASDYQDPLDR